MLCRISLFNAKPNKISDTRIISLLLIVQGLNSMLALQTGMSPTWLDLDKLLDALKNGVLIYKQPNITLLKVKTQF